MVPESVSEIVKRRRKMLFDDLRKSPRPDVLIVGGGVNGVGVLRELVLNGVSAVLLEKDDFCAGASGASSRMAHGGLRYLENREFGLVRESTRERNHLLRNAPHLTGSLEIVVPLSRRLGGIWQSARNFLGFGGKGSAFSLAVLKPALIAYDLFDRGGRVLPRHFSSWGRRHLPTGMRRTFIASAHYFDGLLHRPEALVLEMLGEVTSRPGCIAINHADLRPYRPGEFEVHDRVNGHIARIRPRMIINATGAWIDKVNSDLFGFSSAHVSGSKGAHLILRNRELHRRMAGRGFYFDDGTGRMVITYPLKKTVLLGTTDILVEDPDTVELEELEVAYLISAINTLFEDITVTRDEIVSTTMGTRPLQRSEAGSVYRASRDHKLADDTAGGLKVLSMIGGKWTTFRSFSEQTADLVFKNLGVVRTTDTARSLLPGAQGYPSDEAARQIVCDDITRRAAVPLERAKLWLERYGMLALDLAAYPDERDAPLDTAPDYSIREIAWLVDRRLAVTAEDIVTRRTDMAIDGEDHAAIRLELESLLCSQRSEPVVPRPVASRSVG